MKLRHKRVAPWVYVDANILLPVIFSHKLWLEIWRGIRPRAWDGTGHFAIAQVFDSSIFPDSFGWTQAYFGGMPFPNFYPPLFYWLVALLHHTHLFSFPAAFKLVTVLPVLLMPAAIWWLAWTASDQSRLLATGASLGAIALMVDSRFLPFFPSGLDYFSTFQIGLYTQPLGFVLLLAWWVAYSKTTENKQSPKGKNIFSFLYISDSFIVSAVLLALTILANFFNAITAAVIIAATLATDFMRYRRAADSSAKKQAQQDLITHITTPILALGLAAFWLVPMLSQYEYFVTRPYIIEFSKLISPALIGWYVVALAGSIIWIRRPTRLMQPYLLTCLAMAMSVVFASTLAPRWFPLQSSRFLTTLNFLLAVPVAQAFAFLFRGLAKLLGEINSFKQSLTLTQTRYSTGVALAVLALLAFSSPGPKWAYAFYTEPQKADVDGILSFAREHEDGRYLVEVVNPITTEVAFDARAINSFLGGQGNETLSAVFHEASPNALFALPTVNAFSQYPDSFGISSLLADDLDFAEQALSSHLERAKLMGVRYLVIRTPQMKERVASETLIAARHDFGWWSVFELKGEALPRVRVLPYRPALLVSDFTLKERRSDESNFIRLAEEQFASGWFDVLLARSPEVKIDRLRDLDNFGALVLDKYEYDDENAAFERLKDFAQRRTLIALASEAKLFQRLLSQRTDFPKLEIIESGVDPQSEVLDAIKPEHHYQASVIRQQWQKLRLALEQNKIPVDQATVEITTQIHQNQIQLTRNGDTKREPLPVLLATTFHPDWQRSDRELIYAATPFDMLTFLDQTTSLGYKRKRFDQVALILSLGVWLFLGASRFLFRNSSRSTKAERTSRNAAQ